MPENRLDHLIHAGVPPENRLAHPEKARPGNHNSPDIVEIGKATRWKAGQSGNPGGRPKRTPYADACRALADMTEEQVMEHSPKDPFPLAMAKALGREALGGIVYAAAEIANRAEGTPVQTVRSDTDRTATDELGMNTLATILRIAIARCQAYNLPLPEILQEAMKLQAAEESAEPEDKGE